MENKTQAQQGNAQGWIKRVVYISVGVLLATALFFAGFFVRTWTLDKELQILLDVKNGIQDRYYQSVTDEEFYDTIFDAINDDLLDRYSKYMDKDEYAEYTARGKGKYEGVGLSFNGSAEGMESLKIVRVSGDSPAESVGISAGHYVVGIGASEQTVVALTSYEQFKTELSGYVLNETFVLITSPTATGGTGTAYTVAKQAYTENYVYYRTNTGAYKFSGDSDTSALAYDNALSVLPVDTAYIKLAQFNGNADKAFDSAMSIFKQEQKKNLVLDLRGNGGGIIYFLCINSFHVV